MKKTSADAKKALARTGSSHAMEAMYSGQDRNLFSRGIKQGMSDYVWHRVIAQSMAIRNRLLLVEEYLENAILEYSKSNSESVVKILTVAGGTNKSIIAVIDRLHNKGNVLPISIHNIDLDKDALLVSEQMATMRNCNQYFTRITGNAFDLPLHVAENKFHIIEMVGLLDYLDEEQSVKMLALVKEAMNKNSVLVAANVAPNKEERFIKKLGWPKMYFRTGEHLGRLAELAGFDTVTIEVVKEPLLVHSVLKIKN